MDVRPDADPAAARERVQALLDANHRAHGVAADEAGKPRPVAWSVEEDGAWRGGLVGEFAYGWLTIERLAVVASARRRGLGTALVRAAEAWAMEHGAVGVFLTTMGHEAPDFYRRLGYRLLYVKRDAYGNRDHWYLKEFPDPVFRTVRA